VEYRNGMVNISPIGRNARYIPDLSGCSAIYGQLFSIQERIDFEVLDLVNIPPNLVSLFLILSRRKMGGEPQWCKR